VEKSIIGTWRYDYIIAANTKFELANSTMELSSSTDETGGNRGFIFRRRIAYLPNGTYQLRWIERGDYQLGTEGDPNWQPAYGYWSIKDGKLIHNPGTFYETIYDFTIEPNLLTKSSSRYMSKSLAPYFLWDTGDEITQTEVFVRVETN